MIKDPYSYEDSNVLKNNFGIKDNKKLEKAEAALTMFRLLSAEIYLSDNKDYGFNRMTLLHQYVYGDIFEWAGKLRITDMTEEISNKHIRYTDFQDIRAELKSAFENISKFNWKKSSHKDKAIEMSKFISDMWRVQPFRQGTLIVLMEFCREFASKHDFKFDIEILSDNREYFFKALVAANIDRVISDTSSPEVTRNFKYIENLVSRAMDIEIKDKKGIHNKIAEIKELSAERQNYNDRIKTDNNKNLSER